MKKTFKELNEIDQLVGKLYEKYPAIKDGKFGYAYKRFYEKNLDEIMKEYTNALSDIRIDLALTDVNTKALLRDITPGSRGFQYDKEGMKNVIKKETALDKEWMVKEFEVEPFFIKEENLPEMTDEQKEVLAGVLIEHKE